MTRNAFGFGLWLKNYDSLPASWREWADEVFERTCMDESGWFYGEDGERDLFLHPPRDYEQSEAGYSSEVLEAELVMRVGGYEGIFMATMPRNQDKVEKSWVWKFEKGDPLYLEAQHPYGDNPAEEAGAEVPLHYGRGWRFPKVQVHHPSWDLTGVLDIHKEGEVPIVLDAKTLVAEPFELSVVEQFSGVGFYETDGEPPDWPDDEDDWEAGEGPPHGGVYTGKARKRARQMREDILWYVREIYEGLDD